MTRLLQVSDPHFGTEQPVVVAALLCLVQQLQPQQLLLSGDITQRATRAQFAAARDFVARSGVPCLAIPGNHDLPLFNLALRVRAPYERYCEAFGPLLEPTLERDDVLLLALNTTRWWRHQDGQLSAAQIDRVAQRLARAQPGQCRMVMVHQPLVVTRAEDERNRLHGHAAALQAWGAAGVELLLGGHIHLPFVKALPFGGWAVQAGTAVSSRVRGVAGNSVNLVRTGVDAAPSRAVVEQWDFDHAQKVFVRCQVHRLEAVAAPEPRRRA